MLKRVTITGVDVRTDLMALADLGDRFPFVEWAVLYSLSQMGMKPRYPERARLERIAGMFGGQTHGGLAMHFCGYPARDTMTGETHHLSYAWSRGYRRVQINGFDVTRAQRMEHIFARVRDQAGELNQLILQARDPEQFALLRLSQGPNVHVLFDVSGGQGIGPDAWPLTMATDQHVGFAGGIRPENVGEVLSAIGPRDHDYWIDMETGVRTDDWLDLAKVEQVLLRCQQVIKTQGMPRGRWLDMHLEVSDHA